ncbi:hypothetical protein GDO81_028746 [Engystomops pustulosus]|uniref:Uncharacterized protein n=1 Tax=Engystomops pustulosus TaxID=76066 RepID=A0AAV6YCT3_ENGPU|nr:hypothetical protein GDO81_028746 [Engystomops pustulosus]
MGGGSPCRVHSTPAAPGYDSDPYRLSLLEQYGDAIMRLCQTPDPETAEQDPETMGQDPETAQPNPKTEQDTCVALTHNETKGEELP